MLQDNQDESVRKFFEDVGQTVALDQVSYTPRAPFYMEIQYRVLASALRRAIRQWVTRDSVVLDIGCGHGELLRPLAKNYRIYGVDLSVGLLRAAKARGFRVCQCNATALPFAADQFDTVICAEVLQHFPDLQPLLSELARVCRSGGALIVSTLNKRSLLRAIFDLFSRRSRLASFDLPIMRRTAQDVCDAARSSGWLLRGACWVLSPTPLTAYARPPAPIWERLATNHVLYFTKEPRSGGSRK
jgi:2-polyprenyl-3-methyl-5-hydroxy-6-metoxy-1,4-benzoquinol methylase